MTTKPTPEDIAFFRAQMRGVKRVKTDKVLLKPQRPSSRRVKTRSLETAEEFPFSDHLRETINTDDKLFFSQGGLQEKVLKTLRLGKIPQTQILDLHGATVAQARTLLSDFLNMCLQNDHRCVRIIHGKGKLSLTPPLLKNQVNNWLQQYPDVLAFCSAMPRDGGTGATYVLLRRKKAEELQT